MKLFNGTSALVFDVDYTVQVSSFGHLQILPLKVFAAETTYTLVVTKDLKDIAGTSVVSSIAYDNAKDSGLYSSGIRAAESDAVAAGVDASNILYAANFTTQSIGNELKLLSDGLTAAEISFDSSEAQTYLNSGTARPLSGAIKVGACAIANCVDKVQVEITLPSHLSLSTDLNTGNCVADIENQKDSEFWFELKWCCSSQ